MVRPEVKKKRRDMAIAVIQSRKTRKKLEKVVLHKKSKIDRKNLLAELKKYQLQPNQLEQLHSTSSMQTKGLKRFLHPDENSDGSKVDALDKAEQCLDASLLLSRKRRKGKQKACKNLLSSSSSEDTDEMSTDTEIYYSNSDEDISSNKNIPIQRDSSIDENITESFADKSNQNNSAKGSKTVESDAKPAISLKQSKPAVFILVNRLPEVEQNRLKLPIIGEEQNIMETIRYNDISIVSGETGSGKTTQLPQFLYEAGYTMDGKMIGITEPRRVAAVSMSERVGHELNLTSDEVSYQIRFSGNVTCKTKIKFMTDGVLLRECQQDFLLSKYSALIIDEAHERSVFSDILIGLLSRIVPMRAARNDPLKLIIMSATMRVDDFTQNNFLFRKPPPVIKIESRQFPVSIQFAKTTPSNYLQAAFRKVCSLHSKMPKGGILVFVTSQMEVKVLCNKLRAKFPGSNEPRKKHKRINSIVNGKNTVKSKSIETKSNLASSSKDLKNLILDDMKEDVEYVSEEDGDNQFSFPRSSAIFSDSHCDSDEDEGIVHSTKTPLLCLGLYAMLPLEKQRRVFKDPPDGSRLCVIATNVAETSITIPNIKYVIDTGMEKVKVYDLVTGVSKFITTWTSKSSAEQRAGRAGRMGPGHCYRLYSSAIYTNELPQYAEPRILQKPIDDVLLQMKSMNIDNVVNFPFPTRPSLEALKASEKKLILLGALDDSKFKNARFEDIKKTEFSSRLTPLGKAMAHFAVSARCSKMIVLSPYQLLPLVVCLVSALTVREMFLEGNNWRSVKKKWSGHGESKLLGDFMLMIRAVTAADSFGCSNKMCIENGLRTKAMLEINKLRDQLVKEINTNLNHKITKRNQVLKKPNETQNKVLRQLLLSCFCDHVARKLPDGVVVENSADDPNKIIKKKLKHAYECMESEGPVYISNESALKGEHHEFVIYRELYKGDKKTYMRDVAVIKPEWLPHYAYKLCHFSESTQVSETPPKYDHILDQVICTRPTTYGTLNWSLGSIDLPMKLVDSGTDIYKYFACFLLAGEVFDWFKKYVKKLFSPPTIMTKPWSKLQPRTSKLLQALVSHNIRSKSDLTTIWKKDETSPNQSFAARVFSLVTRSSSFPRQGGMETAFSLKLDRNLLDTDSLVRTHRMC